MRMSFLNNPQDTLSGGFMGAIFFKGVLSLKTWHTELQRVTRPMILRRTFLKKKICQ